MPQTIIPPHQPRWYWIPVRVVLITFLLTLLSFAICLLLGILGLVVAGALRGVHPNLASAYRHFAFPVAMVIAAVVLISATIMEVRRYRRMKALAGIVRASS
jgi:hypothetical protein